MDYDAVQIADVYDSGRQYRPEVLQMWLDLVSAHLCCDRVEKIIDLGCGTGRYSGALAAHFGASVLGIDPSEQMLEQARWKDTGGRAVFKQASGENLPEGDSIADMIFMSMVLHHLPDLRRTAFECRRVLRPSGGVFIRNSTVDAMQTFHYLKFFPAVRPLIEEQLPARGDIKHIFQAAGFDLYAHEIVPYQVSPSWSAFTDKLATRSDSFLARISDADFHAGLASLRAHSESVDPREVVTEDVDFFVFQRPAAED